MRSPSFVNSALAAHMLFVIPLITRGSVATTTTSIQDGDTFLAIAASAGIPVASLEAANPGVSATDLYAGQIINLPAGNEPATNSPASNPGSSTATAAALTTLVTSASPSVGSNTSPSDSSSTTPSVSASGSSTMASPTSMTTTSLSSSTLSSTTTTSGSSKMVSSSTSTSISPSSTSITSTSSTLSPSSSPSVTSTSSPPPPAPAVPSTTTTSTCMPTPTGKYHDASGVQSKTNTFCAQNVGTTLEVVQNESGGLNGDNQSANKNDGSTPNEGGYNMTITAISGCSIPGATVTFPLPQLPMFNCTRLLFDSYKNCNNEGMGGSVTAGCLVYSFLPDP